MSHFATVNTAISDIKVLATCLQAKGLRVTYGEKIRGYQSQPSDISYVIAGCNDTLQRDLGYRWATTPGPDGKICLVCDFHSDQELGAIMAAVAVDYRVRKSGEQAQHGLNSAKMNVRVMAGVC